ncbi:TrmH family RNA methyltransferase [Candidatus Poribacteria bacterium]
MAKQIKKYRKNFDYSYTLGVFPTIELLNSKEESVLKILIGSKGERNKGFLEIKEICRDRNVRFEVNDRLINRLSPKENCYAVGIFRKFQAPLKSGKNHLVLVNPGDMGNLGTIVRTMLGFCVDNLALIRPAVDIFDPKVIRSSMGAVFQISFQYFDSIYQYTEAFSNSRYTFMTNGKTALDKVTFREPFSIVFGNESSGLPDEYLELGTSVNIPHDRNIDSLNLSISVGIGLYEAMKDKTF